MLQWLILNCNQNLQANFLAFYDNLVSPVRDLMRHEKFLKVCLADKKSLLMKSFQFLMTYLKICFWSWTYTTVILHSQLHYWSSSNDDNGMRWKFIQRISIVKSQGISYVQISISHHFLKLRYYCGEGVYTTYPILPNFPVCWL